jgi:hypothetical protein
MSAPPRSKQFGLVSGSLHADLHSLLSDEAAGAQLVPEEEKEDPKVARLKRPNYSAQKLARAQEGGKRKTWQEAETASEKAAYGELASVIPKVGEIESLRVELFTKLGGYFTNPSVGNITPGFTIGMLDRLDHYFRLLYANLHSTVLDLDYPQRNMVYALDTQRQILQTLHNFVFVDGSSSDMPQWLAKSRRELSRVFGEVNNSVADYVNTRNSQPDVINRHSGFLAHPSEPLPNGTFRDGYDLY